jgi:hypothetical protein
MYILMRAAMAAGLCLCMTSAYSQMSPSHQKTVGYQDEQGVFHPFNQMVPDIAKTDYTGTIDVTVKITVKSTFKTGTIIACGTEALVSSYSATNPLAGLSYDEWNYAEATGSGTSYTCTLKIPYSWSLLSPGTGVENSMSATYEVLALAPSGSIFSTGLGLRETSGPIVQSAPIPAIGATTSYTVNATI